MPRRILTSRAYQLVPEPVSQAMMHFSGSRGDNSQNTRCGLSGLASFIARFFRTSHHSFTFFSIVSRQERSALRSSSGSSLRKGRRAVADQVDLHRVAHADHAGIDVDLDPARLAFLGEEFGIGEARPDHEEGVATGHHLIARPRAEEPDRAGHEGQIIRQGGFPEQRLGNAGAELVGGLDHLVSGVRALPHRPGSPPSFPH